MLLAAAAHDHRYVRVTQQSDEVSLRLLQARGAQHVSDRPVFLLVLIFLTFGVHGAILPLELHGCNPRKRPWLGRGSERALSPATRRDLKEARRRGFRILRTAAR